MRDDIQSHMCSSVSRLMLLGSLYGVWGGMLYILSV
jgi:hypothetical protein